MYAIKYANYHTKSIISGIRSPIALSSVITAFIIQLIWEFINLPKNDSLSYYTKTTKMTWNLKLYVSRESY